MEGTTAYDGACACVGLIEAGSTLEHLFAPGQRIDELDTDDFGELVELVMESAKRRGDYELVVETARVIPVDEWSDARIAAAVRKAEADGSDSTEVLNEVCARLNLPPEMTEQGLTPAAADLVEAWLMAAEAGGTP